MIPSRHSCSALAVAGLVALAACAPDAPTAVATAADAPLAARAGTDAGWSVAASIEQAPPGAHPTFNTAFLDGCPVTSRDGKAFYLASTRPGGLGGIDIWVSTRGSTDEPWGAPVNLGAPVNSEYNDFCPMPARDGHGFFFVSNRPGGCGGTDIYATRRRGDRGWDAPENLGCAVNSAADEAGPVPANEPGSGPVLYFSSTRAGGFAPEPAGAQAGDSDLYRSEWHGGAFGRPALVLGVNSAAEDGQPYVRRDALELYFFSTRPGTLGAADIYVATRTKARDAWTAPANLGPAINSAAAETRPSLSWDSATLYFGSTRAGGEGINDIYVATRERVTGRPD